MRLHPPGSRNRLARREAIRLLLEDFREESRSTRFGGYARPQDRSVQGLRAAMQMMLNRDADDARWLVSMAGCRRLRSQPPDVQKRVNALLDEIADQLPFPIVPPARVLLDLYYEATHRLHPDTLEVAYELAAAEEEETARLDPDDDVDYTDGRRAGRLDSEGSSGGRFTAIGVDPARDSYTDNTLSGTGGGVEPVRWRTRERRGAVPPIGEPAQVVALLEQHLGEDLGAIRQCLVRGRPSKLNRRRREELARAIAEVRAVRRVSVATLSAVLNCDPATIWRLQQRGDELIARSSICSSERERKPAA